MGGTVCIGWLTEIRPAGRFGKVGIVQKVGVKDGMEDYAAQIEREYETQAERLAINDMMRSDLTSPPYPEGLYGRAYVTGRSLSDAAGWHALCLLGRIRKGTDVPDVAAWARRLSLEGNAQPGRILGITHARV